MENQLLNRNRYNVCQLDGNASISSYASEEEIDSEPVRAVFVPAQPVPGQPFSLDVASSDGMQAPSSLPLTMVANFRSAYNKKGNIKKSMNVLGLDLLVASETWERPHYSLEALLESPHYKIVSYCRGRDPPALRTQGRHAGKQYPPKTGGGAAVIYNKNRFELDDYTVTVPAGIEVAWAVLSPRRMDDRLQRVRRICVAAVYIAPGSPFKDEAIDHLIHTIHLIRAKYNNEVHFLLAGDYNRVGVHEILRSHGALQQICDVPTRKGATLQLIITDLHTYMHPPTAQPPMQKDEGAKGMDGDHQTLMFAPKASKEFIVQREKKTIVTRPLPQSSVDAFCFEMTRHKWTEVLEAECVDEKAEKFHNYLRELLDKHCPEKSVTVSNLDKPWMNPQLKELLRQVQRERLKKGKNGHFKELWAKFRRMKRHQIKNFHKKFVQDLKTTNPAKWFQKIKQLGGLDQSNRGRLKIRELAGLSDKDCAESVAQSFAATSQEYSRLDRTKLPTFLPAGRPEEVNIFQVQENIKKVGKTKSTLPIDLPDTLRKECSLDLAEPMQDIINCCLRDGRFPRLWKREWVTPVPKLRQGEELKTCDDVRKVASTSDFAKIFEIFLRGWITEDIGHKIDANQFAGRKGAGTEHMLVWMIDRVLSLLDKPGMRAVIKASVDWASAFSRTDPTKTISKYIAMGLRPSLVNVLIDFLEDRHMSVKFNSEESSLYKLIGGGPQGSWTGQECFLVASNDNADFVSQEDRFKYSDDLSILEIIMLGDILTQYNFHDHVASDIGVDQLFLPPQYLETQKNLHKISSWTKDNLMKLKESKTDYLFFTRSTVDFTTRLTLNNKYIERKEISLLLGVWLQEDGGWETNTVALCKKAYARMGMLTKLRYAGACTEDLIYIYKQFIRSKLEYCSVVFHSSLTLQQSYSLERCQAVCLRIILMDMYVTYSSALEMTGLSKLSDRRLNRCLDFSLKCLKDPYNSRFFPKNPNLNLTIESRKREQFKINFSRTNSYKNSTIPFCQRLLNNHWARLEQEEEEGEGEEEEGEEAG